MADSNALATQPNRTAAERNEGQIGSDFLLRPSASKGRTLLRVFGTAKHIHQLALLDQIKSCAKECNISKGSQFHAHLLKEGLLTNDTYVGTALLCMYARCGALAKAKEVFCDLFTPDVAAWNALISAHVQHGLGHEALEFFEQMLNEGHSPDEVTFVCVLKACACSGAVKDGEAIHAEVHRQGLIKRNILVGTALVDMYGKCGVLVRAQEVFDELPYHDIVSWNALIAGYAQHGHSARVLSCYKQLCKEGLSPNAVTFVCVLKACGAVRATDIGENIHAEIRKRGLLGKNVFLATALVDMYAKCGAVLKAQEVFDELLERDVALWNALISGYAQNELGEEALRAFCEMQKEHALPDTVTFLSVSKACGTIGAAKKGQELFEVINKQQLMATSVELSNAMVDMYAKCGLLTEAQEVFDGICARTVSSWNSIMAGYAQLGKIERVFSTVNAMLCEHVQPDQITFSILLTACSHAGLLNKGQLLFQNMSMIHCIIPTVHHYACMIDLVNRAGQSDKAVSIMNQVPGGDFLILCSVLLSTCQKGSNVELGYWILNHVLKLDHHFAGGYVYLSNLFANSCMQELKSKQI